MSNDERTSSCRHFTEKFWPHLHMVDPAGRPGLPTSGRPWQLLLPADLALVKQYVASVTEDIPDIGLPDEVAATHAYRRPKSFHCSWRLPDRELHPASDGAADRCCARLGAVHLGHALADVRRPSITDIRQMAASRILIPRQSAFRREISSCGATARLQGRARSRTGPIHRLYDVPVTGDCAKVYKRVGLDGNASSDAASRTSLALRPSAPKSGVWTCCDAPDA